MVARLLELLHSSAGLPWWGAVVVTSLAFRVAMMPMLYSTVRVGCVRARALARLRRACMGRAQLTNGQRMAVHADEMKSHYARMAAARASGDTKLLMTISAERKDFMTKHNISGMRMFLPFLQLPLMLWFFWGVRELSDLPMMSASIKHGGALWFPDLSVADPYFVLPAVTVVFQILSIQVLVLRARAGVARCDAPRCAVQPEHSRQQHLLSGEDAEGVLWPLPSVASDHRDSFPRGTRRARVPREADGAHARRRWSCLYAACVCSRAQSLQLYTLATAAMMSGHTASLNFPAYRERVIGLPRDWPECMPKAVLPAAVGQLFGVVAAPAAGAHGRDVPSYMSMSRGLVDPGPPPPPRAPRPAAGGGTAAAAAPPAAASAPLPSFLAVGHAGLVGTYPSAPAVAPPSPAPATAAADGAPSAAGAGGLGAAPVEGGAGAAGSAAVRVVATAVAAPTSATADATAPAGPPRKEKFGKAKKLAKGKSNPVRK